MSLYDRIQDDVKAAMKGGRRDELTVLRSLVADIKNVLIAKKLDRAEVPDELALATLRKGVKQRQDSVEQYEKGGRQDLVEVEAFQIEVLRKYLPTEMADAEIEVIVDTVIVELGATDRSAMGLVMKAAMGKVAGRADGKRVSGVVASRLS